MYIITGTSTGIGKAIAEYYLEKGEKVIGISRRNDISHENFTFLKCDFTERQQMHDLDLASYISQSDKPVTLINNAGVIGDIKRSNEQTLTHYADLALVNLVAPQFLTSCVIQHAGFDQVDAVVFISSGAAQRPVPSWAAYCSSKAAIDMFAQTLAAEIDELNKNTRVYSIAPGIVDTNMQKSIRNSEERNFSGKQHFVQLKENNELRSPQEVAKLLDQFLSEKHDAVVNRL
ncbi:MAG: SDR family NAD(P)-dependent oxidoreductase [Brumimicrobium sp.]|nr:SDR family NAD(P)-dependent oxidoreductase [Brumimicrobium sp.]